jgi:hypothetical protein
MKLPREYLINFFSQFVLYISEFNKFMVQLT